LKPPAKGFCRLHLASGDPHLEATRQLCARVRPGGVDVLEVGVPFSDPLADGLVNQLAAQRGLESGHHAAETFGNDRGHRREIAESHRLYINFNLIHRVGMRSSSPTQRRQAWTDCSCWTCRGGKRALRIAHARGGLCHIYLVAPTTPEDAWIHRETRRGLFIYYISRRKGVTGMQSQVGDETSHRRSPKSARNTALPSPSASASQTRAGKARRIARRTAAWWVVRW